MSSVAHLCISNFYLASNSSWINPYILSIFQKDDIQRFKRKCSERNKHAWGVNQSSEIELAIVYSNTIKNIKDRLDVLGITMKKVLEVFNYSKNKSVEKLEEYLYFENINEYEEHNLATINLLKSSCFHDFMEAFNIIIENEYHLYKTIVPDNVAPLVKYLLSDSFCEFDKFPGSNDFRILLRAVIENMDQNLLVQYDITDIAHGNYPNLIEGNNDDLVSIYDEVLSMHQDNSYELGSKIIILTEGTSDITILKNSLKILYPHLFDYYSFMDHNISNAAGGASALVSSIKSFISAGVQNKIIAIFDNDTAAFVARKGLTKVRIPANIKVTNYPDISIANNYPTLGPSGITNMNINGLACSIELYLGEEILSDEENNLSPVQWKGFEESLGKYQGEILKKAHLQNKFLKKSAECMKFPHKIKLNEWIEMHLVLNTIFQAFNT